MTTELSAMRVALVLATSAGGVGQHVRSLAAGLVGRGVRVSVLGPSATEEMFAFGETGAAFRAVEIADRPRPMADMYAVTRLRRLLRGTHVAHAHGLRAGGLCALALARSRRRKPPLVVTLHNAAMGNGLSKVAYAFLERVMALRTDVVLAVSSDLMERVRAAGVASVRRALVAAPPLPAPRRDRDAVRAALEVGSRPLVLAVGRLSAQKGYPSLLDAAAHWSHRVPPPLVAVVGDGPLRDEISLRVDAEHLPVRLLGRRGDVADLLAAADVVVVPSVWEGQPLVVQEALRAGRPLVATRVGGIPEMVDDAALLVPAGDPAVLESTVARVLDDPSLAERLADAARERAAILPTEEDTLGQVSAVYQELAGPAAPYNG